MSKRLGYPILPIEVTCTGLGLHTETNLAPYSTLQRLCDSEVLCQNK